MNFKHFNALTFLVIATYFVQGAVVVTGISEFLLTRNAFQFSWIQLAMLSSISVLAWSIKPIYGFLTDLVPLFGSRRKYYLILASLLASLGYMMLAFFGTGFLLILLGILILNIGMGFADVITDGLVVESAKKEELGWYQALSWRAKAVGIFFASLFSGMILERQFFSRLFQDSSLVTSLETVFPTAFPTELISGVSFIDIRFTFLVAGLLPFITLICAFLMKADHVSKSTQEKAEHSISLTYIISAGIAFVLSAMVLILLSKGGVSFIPGLSQEMLASLLVILIWSVWILAYSKHLIDTKVTTTTLLFAALFIFLWRFTPSFSAPWNDYYLNVIQLSQEKLGYASSLQPLGWFIGSFLYVKFFDRTAIKKLLFWTVIVSVLLSLTQLIVPSQELAKTVGSISFIKILAGIILYPAYFLAYGFSAWQEVMTQHPIINIDAVLTFLNEMMFIIAFLPLLKLAAVVTPKGVEATNFAVLMSIMNLGLAFGSISGGMIYQAIEGGVIVGAFHLTGLHIAILIGAFASLLCLPVLKYLKV